MGLRKSQIDVEFYINLISNVLRDAYVAIPGISLRECMRDIRTVLTRVDHEGFEFLTKTLPKLGKSLDRALETGQLVVPPEFGRKSKGGKQQNIPTFMSALFLTVFDDQGHLDHGKKHAVASLRQVCFLCYKVEVPYKEKQVKACLDKFVNTDYNLPVVKPLSKYARTTIRCARLLLRKLFRGFDPTDITPRHGPGAVAEQSRGRGKSNDFFFDPRIDSLYPLSSYATFGVHAQSPEALVAHLQLRRDCCPARVVCVPKDSRGPRIISAEPAMLQYLQQGLGRSIIHWVENHPLTRGSVLFTNQEIHRKLATLGSHRPDTYSTLDMSDASDRVSLSLIRELFPDRLLPYLEGIRSGSSRLPDGRLVELKKFAPMGSALCFPIEALAFWALSLGAIRAVSRARVYTLPSVYIYGDDIIVPTEYARAVILLLESFGLKFNMDKCFIAGNFRESCGKDAYHAEDVTPVKIHALLSEAPHSSRVVGRKERIHRALKDLSGTVGNCVKSVCRSSSLFREESQKDLVSPRFSTSRFAKLKPEVFSLSENANAFFDKGYWCTAKFIDEWISEKYGEIPILPPVHSGCLYRTSTLFPVRTLIPAKIKARWNKDWQRREIRMMRLRSLVMNSPFPSDLVRLGHNLTLGMIRKYEDEVAVPHSALPKAGWVGI